MSSTIDAAQKVIDRLDAYAYNHPRKDRFVITRAEVDALVSDSKKRASGVRA